MKRVSGSKSAGAPTTSIEDMERSVAIMNARSRFVIEALNMGWKMAFTVIIPVFVGVKLDEHFDTSPSWTLTGLFLAIAGAAMVVASTLKNIKAEQDRNAAKPKKRRLNV